MNTEAIHIWRLHIARTICIALLSLCLSANISAQNTKVHLHFNFTGKILQLETKKHSENEKQWSSVNETPLLAPNYYDFKLKTTCGDTVFTNIKVVKRANQHFYFEIKPNPTYDCDGDGVVNATDKEAGTPIGCPVDAEGRAKDSDGDGVKDCKDDDPYSLPRPNCDDCYFDNPTNNTRKKGKE